MLEEFGTDTKNDSKRIRCPKCNRFYDPGPGLLEYSWNLNFGIKNAKPIFGCGKCFKKLWPNHSSDSH